MKSVLLRRKPVIAILLAGLIILLVWFVDFESIVTGESNDENFIADDHEKELSDILWYLDKATATIYSYPDSSRYFSEKGLELASRINYLSGIHRIYTIIGTSFIVQSQYKNALDAFFKSLELAISNHDRKRVLYAYNNIGAVYIKTNQYRDALDSFLKAKELFNSMDDSAGISSLNNNIGQIYYELGEDEKAKKYYFRAYNAFKAENDLHNLLAVSANIANYYFKMNIPDSADYYFDYSLTLADSLDNKFLQKNIKAKKGNFLLSLGDYLGAVDCYMASDSLAKVLNVRQERPSPVIGLAKAYLGMKNYEKALYFAEEAHAIADYYNNEVMKYLIYEVFADIYELTGNYQLAYSYYKEAKEQQSRLSDQTEAYSVFQVELEHLNRQMEVRDFEMEKNKLLMSKNRNTFRFIVVILLLLILILSLSYFYYLGRVRNAEKERQHQSDIKHSYEQNRAAIEAENNERKRLGMELHDGIGPLLSLTKLTISNVLDDDLMTSEKKKKLLARTSNYLDDILKEMRHVSNNLAPIILIDKGLEYALKSLVSKVNSLNKHTTHLNISGLSQPLDAFYDLALYRTIQEIINNIVKHADADEISIDITEGEDDITVMIEDNGKGFLVEEIQFGLGLSSAKSRIEGLLGRFLIDSKPGRGTIVSIILPVKDLFPGEVDETRP
jgi:two-component system, NarL family, sensor kinase